MNQILEKYLPLNKLNVSRETCLDFEKLISMLLDENEKINLISKREQNQQTIRNRHIIDSAQAIDFVDLNINTTSDLGSGGGFPGLVMAIMIKNMKKNARVDLYEKSYHKSSFLREASRKLNLNTKVIQLDIFGMKKLKTGTIIARAFKPLPIILELVSENFISYKNLILYMGENGKKILEETLKDWNFEYEKQKSITNENSFLLNIKNIKKKNKN